MSKLSIKNASNDLLNIDVIRYFLNNDNEYLIYSLDETVGDGYIKLYASKIIGNAARIIADDSEWLLVKEIVKNIIKANHEGLELSVVDLTENDLEAITLLDTRVFKLQANLVNLLSDNKKIEEVSPILEKFEAETLSVDETEETEEIEEEIDVDYQEMYVDQLEKLDRLNERIKDLEEQLEKHKNIFDKIKNIIEE